jgi:hypothetical protein
MAQTINWSGTTPAAPANAINVAWQNDSSTPPNISANVPSGVGGAANIVARKVLTAQTAAQSSVSLLSVPSSGAGFYKVHYVTAITTAATTGAATSTLGGSAGFQLVYTNGNGDAVSKTTVGTVNNSTANTTGTSISGCVAAYCSASSTLAFSFGYASNTAAQMAYDLAIFVEFVGA